MTTENVIMDLAAVYDLANQLNLAGYQLTILENYGKKPLYSDWNKIQGKPVQGMTGVGIVAGSNIKGTSKYIYIVDIDIYESEKGDNVLNEILELFGEKKVYIESTTSGGYHLIFHAEKKLTNIKKVYHFKGGKQQAGDKVEFFSNGQCLIAPSMAYNKKTNSIGQYVRLFDVDIQDAAVLTSEELDEFLESLESLSKEYQDREITHNHTTTSEHQAELIQTYKNLTNDGFTCGFLYGGNNFNPKPSWNQDQDVISGNHQPTGIRIKLGRQSDGTYLVCIDFSMVDFQMVQTIADQIEISTYIEQTVSGGYHLFVRTKIKPDLPRKLQTHNSGKISLLYYNNQSVNIAPTCAFAGVNEYGMPVYQTSQAVSGSLDSIGIADISKLQEILQPFTLLQSKTGMGSSNRERDKIVFQHLYKYGNINEIDRQIKLIFPDLTGLMDCLNIPHAPKPTKDYLRFYSLAEDDGNNPDALLYHNDNLNIQNKWPGYSVLDTHTGETRSFAKYLCQYQPDKFDSCHHRFEYGLNPSV